MFPVKNINFNDLEKSISNAIKEFRIEPRYLELELTERVMMDNPHDAKQALKNSRNLAFRLPLMILVPGIPR